MKQIGVLFLFLVVRITTFSQTEKIYDIALANFSTKTYNGESFDIVRLKQKSGRIKAKLFSSDSIKTYNKWKESHNVITLFTAGYTDGLSIGGGFVGLACVDGVMQNNSLEKNRLDGLVVLDSNGMVKIHNISQDTIVMNSSDLADLDNISHTFKMSSPLGVEMFIEHAKDEKLSLFQTHLLVYNDSILLGSNSSPTSRARRFLLIARNSRNEIEHFIINKPQSVSLLVATDAVVSYLKTKSYTVNAMVNLDAGACEYFECYKSDGCKSDKLKGIGGIKNALPSIMVYYFE